MGRGRAPINDTVSADDIQHFFDTKVAAVRASTSDAPPPSFIAAPLGCVIRPLTVIYVVAAVRVLPDKQRASDLLPTRVLKDNVDILAPFLVEFMNRLLVLGIVSSDFKSALITPLLKKVNLDQLTPSRTNRSRTCQCCQNCWHA